MKTVYYNGVVYTGELPLVSAFAVEKISGNDGGISGSQADGTVLAVNDDLAAAADKQYARIRRYKRSQFIHDGLRRMLHQQNRRIERTL